VDGKLHNKLSCRLEKAKDKEGAIVLLIFLLRQDSRFRNTSMTDELYERLIVGELLILLLGHPELFFFFKVCLTSLSLLFGHVGF